jgi:predicted thioesterase
VTVDVSSIPVSSTAEVLVEVTDADTAIALGSGDVPVLATPRLVAFAEQATVAAIAPHLSATSTSVGTKVEIDHVHASPVGHRVAVRATLVHVEQRSLVFEVTAVHPADHRLVAHGRITRVVVDRARFLGRLG